MDMFLRRARRAQEPTPIIRLPWVDGALSLGGFWATITLETQLISLSCTKSPAWWDRAHGMRDCDYVEIFVLGRGGGGVGLAWRARRCVARRRCGWQGKLSVNNWVFSASLVHAQYVQKARYTFNLTKGYTFFFSLVLTV